MGRVLLVAGSRGMAGAAAMAAEAGLRSGAGYVYLAAPGGIAAELTAAVPSAVLKLCGDSSRETLQESDQVDTSVANSLVIGPGLGEDASTLALVDQLVTTTAVPTLIDADALHQHLPTPSREHSFSTEQWVLTPHPGEAARLLGLAGSADVEADRPAALGALVDKYGCTVLLKGADTLIGAPGTEQVSNTSGNPGMATAGSGDVLSGCIGALMARGLAPFEATRLGAWLHGRAGDLAAMELGQESLIATDLLKFLPRAILEHQE